MNCVKQEIITDEIPNEIFSVVVKQESSMDDQQTHEVESKVSIQKSLHLQIKSEFPNQKFTINSDNDLDMKIQQPTADEIIIKNETISACAAEKPSECNISTKKSKRKPSKKMYTRKKSFKCKICAFKTLYKQSLQGHLVTHTEEKPFECKICSKTYRFKDNLRQHAESHTGKNKRIECKICNYKCDHKGHLQKHMRIHTGEKPFSCILCKKRFSQKSNLKTHLSTVSHTGEKLFKCEICNKNFSQKGTLLNHMKIHSGEKPYACEVCHHKFVQKINLQNHMKTHTGEKPFKCEICKRKFSRNSRWVNHMKRHKEEILL